MIERAKVIFGLLGLLLVLVPLVGLSDEFNQPRPASIHCVTHEFAPFVFTDHGQNITGIEVDVFEQVSEVIGVDLNIIVMPWARAIEETRQGKIPCIFAVFDTPERRAFLDYGEVPIHISKMVFFTHKSQQALYPHFDKVIGKTVAKVRGFANPPRIQQLYDTKAIRLQEVTELERSFALLNRQRVDLLLYNQMVGEWIISNTNTKDIVALPFSVEEVPAFIAISKSSGLSFLLKDIDSALETILASDDYSNLISEYLNNNQESF